MILDALIEGTAFPYTLLVYHRQNSFTVNDFCVNNAKISCTSMITFQICSKYYDSDVYVI